MLQSTSYNDSSANVMDQFQNKKSDDIMDVTDFFLQSPRMSCTVNITIVGCIELRMILNLLHMQFLLTDYMHNIFRMSVKSIGFIMRKHAKLYNNM